jgi:hypothetical protein
MDGRINQLPVAFARYHQGSKPDRGYPDPHDHVLALYRDRRLGVVDERRRDEYGYRTQE